jgi:hypothetical protein
MLSGFVVILPILGSSPITAGQLFPLVAALYVMVRGLDNIGKALQGTANWPRWKRLFEGVNGRGDRQRSSPGT